MYPKRVGTSYEFMVQIKRILNNDQLEKRPILSGGTKREAKAYRDTPLRLLRRCGSILGPLSIQKQ